MWYGKFGHLVADVATASRLRPEWPDDGVKIGSLERVDTVL